ncbi:MAG: hypothetical protein HC915_05935 [Anaerolineae bacterium]|nr:hypothetical protein [Anaerolineae bacterium]
MLPVLLLLMLLLALLLGALVLYGGNNVLPGVTAGGVELGGKSQAEAAQALEQGWHSEGILLRDGDRRWRIDPRDAGIALDSAQTAAAAHAWGRERRWRAGRDRSLALRGADRTALDH